MNQINVNIKFNEEEKAEWIKYHNRLDRFDYISIPLSIITVMITLTIYVLTIAGYEGSYLDISHSLLYLLTEKFIIQIATCEMAIIYLLFRSIAAIGRKRQDISKQMVIKIMPEGNKIELSIERLRTGKILYHNYINVSEFLNTMCNKDKIVIDNGEYIIGKNNMKHINSNNTEELCKHIPKTKPSDINDIKKLTKLLSTFYGC